MKGRSSAGLFAVSLFVAVSAGAGQDAAKFRLKEVAAVGDSAAVTESFQMKMTIKVSGAGLGDPTTGMQNREEKAYVGNVLSVSPQGRPTGLRLRFSSYRETEQEPGQPAKQRTSAAEGKTVTLKRVGGKTVVTISKGTLSAKDRKDLEKMLDEREVEPFPDRPLAIGEEWTLDSKKLARMFGTEGDAKLQGKLVERTQHGGHPCVRAHLIIQITGGLEGQDAKMTLKLEGDLFYATDLNRSLSLSLTGPVTLAGEIKEGGQSIKLSGDGTARMSMDYRWTRIGGKAVKPGRGA